MVAKSSLSILAYSDCSDNSLKNQKIELGRNHKIDQRPPVNLRYLLEESK
jgi:hypothetical protein